MKKNLFLCLISLSLILCFAACSNSKKNETKENTSAVENSVAKTTETEPKQPVTETVDRQIIDWADEETIEIMKIYKSILQDEAEFFEVYENKTRILSQMMDTMDNRLSFGRFAVIDLDGDNRMEFILSLDGGELHNIFFLIFHSEDKKVYEYTLAYRQFMGLALKIDGSFSVSGGGFFGISTISFQSDETGNPTCLFDDFTYYQGDDKWNMSYYVNHNASTKAKFDKAITIQDNKPDATWYDYTEENVESFFQIP